MTEIVKILLTSGFTIIGACLVLAAQRFVLDPLNEQSRTLGRITFAMHYFGREYNSPVNPSVADPATQQRYWVAADRIRELGSSLAETSQGIRFYQFWLLLGLTPRREKVDEAIGLLTRMSNSMFAFSVETQEAHVWQNWKDADSIIKLLGLRRWGR